jgi:hypothetical protein
MDVVSELMYWCSYGKCYIREQKDARPRVDALTALEHTCHSFLLLLLFCRLAQHSLGFFSSSAALIVVIRSLSCKVPKLISHALPA